MTRPEVLLLNNYAFPKAIARHVHLIHLALGNDRSQIVSLITKRSDRAKRFEGTVYYGYQSKSRPWELVVNHFLASRVFRCVKNLAQETAELGGTVHYCAPTVAPLYRGPGTVVSIYDDPAVELNTDLYSHSVYYRRGVRHFLRSYAQQTPAIVLSEHVKRGLVAWGYEQPVWVVPPSVDPAFRPLNARQALRRKYSLPEDKWLVLSVSNTSRRKNLKVIPEVMQRLGGRYSLVRVGEPLDGSITFADIPDEALNELYNACDVLLYPSLEEGYGLPVVEAFAAGLPVVASAIPAIRESAEGTALLVDPNDPQAIAATVRTAIEKSDELRAQGLKRASEFSLDHLRGRLERVYGELRRCGS